MKVLIILPNWLGDTVMATPAIELLSQHYPNAKFTFVGSYVSIEAIKYHPQCEKTIVDETKKSSSRLLATYKLARELESLRGEIAKAEDHNAKAVLTKAKEAQ